MASYRWNEKEYPQIPYDEWTSGELSVAEHALGKSLDGSSTGDIAAAMFMVAVLRVEPETHPVIVADAARKMPMSALAIAPDEKEASPLEELPADVTETDESNGHVDQLTSGRPPLVPSE